MDTIYLDIDSQYRNRLQFPNPYDFTINYSDEKNNETLLTSANPISDAYPIKEWSWNSFPPIQIITSGDQTLITDGGLGANLYVVSTIPQQHRVENSSDGTGLTFNIITKPTVVSNKLTAGELKICTYGSGYVEGETLKIHRDDIFSNFGSGLFISDALVPILMTKGFETKSGYTTATTYSTSGGSGSGRTITLTITKYSND